MKAGIFFQYSLFSVLFLMSCKKEPVQNNWVPSDYKGSYKNIEYYESLIREYTPGIYQEKDIPEEIQQLKYGRVEIDFRYDGGALTYFMPLFYYGSMNKNDSDDNVEAPNFHFAVEIGHYNVIPNPVEYLFYTICTYDFPQYCRDTYWPVTPGQNYTMVIDKRPEAIILQLKQGEHIINIFPHAFFPDSIQMFFKDVTDYTEHNKGDSLKKVLMVGKGFAGIENGIHTFNGEISGVRIYQYIILNNVLEYELVHVRNQHVENQQVIYSMNDILFGSDKMVQMKYEFWPYKFQSGELIPNGSIHTVTCDKTTNNKSLTYNIKSGDLGFYKVYLQTFDENENIIGSATQPFEIWVYPKEWNFEFY